MRITTAQLYDNLLSGVQKQLDIQNRGNSKISTGTRFQTPAEAAIDYRTSLDIRHAQKGVQGGLEAIAIAESRLSVSQNHLNTMGNIFTRLETLAVQQSSGQNTIADRQAVVAEVNHLKAAFLKNANQKWQGQALFSGTAVDKDAFIENALNVGTAVYTPGANTSITNITQSANPDAVNDTYTITMDAAGTSITSITNGGGSNLLSAPVALTTGANSITLTNRVGLSITYNGTPDTVNQSAGSLAVTGATAPSVTYNGSAQDRVVTISDTQNVVSNARGDAPAFATAFQAILDFENGLDANDPVRIQSALGSLISGGEAIIDLTSDVGARLHALSFTKTAYTDMQTHFDIRLAEHEGVDVPAVVTEIEKSNISLQASYSQIAQLRNLSLMNFLR